MTLDDVTKEVLGELNSMDSGELIEWAFANFKGRAAIGTSFQLTGSVIIDLAAKRLREFRVFTVDTGRLHRETCDTITAFEDRYKIKVERFAPDEKEVAEMVDRFGEFLFFTDKSRQEHCCYVRKVKPNDMALKTLDVWITGLRNDQSRFRKSVPRAVFVKDGERKVLKLAPLVDWELDRIWKYISDGNVPYNSLFDQGYDSVGCYICSTPLQPGEEPRAGRWRWFNSEDDKKECGLHTSKEEVNDGTD